jgi:hypothetical protein
MRSDFESPTERANDPYFRLVASVEKSQIALTVHPLYRHVDTLYSLRIFMRNHVFAVWDFMSLVKALQLRLTSVTVPWLPPPDAVSARLVNDIVLGEETDEVEPGWIISHYELYLRAMDDVGADTAPVRALVDAIRRGVDPEAAIAPLPIPESTKDFVRHTIRVANGPTHEIASAFLLGREDVIPGMFRRLLGEMDTQDGASQRATRALDRFRRRLPEKARGLLPHALTRSGEHIDHGADPRRNFRLYLERHIEVDEGHHAPMGRRLLRFVCGEEPRRWQEAASAAEAALAARSRLWDGVLGELRGETARAPTKTEATPSRTRAAPPAAPTAASPRG